MSNETTFWAGTVRAVEKGIIPVLHIITAVLAAVALQSTIKTAPWLSWVLALIMSFLIERLIAKVLPTTVAAGIRGYWRTGMFWIMAAVSSILLAVNPYLAWKGGQQATDKIVQPFNYSSTEKLDAEQAREQARTRKAYSDAVHNLEKQQQAIAKSIRDKYAAQIAAQESLIAGRKSLAEKGHKWALSYIPAYKKEISRLQAKRDEEIAQSVVEVAQKITVQQEKAATMDSLLASQFAARRQTVDKGNELRRARWDRTYTNVGGVMFLFGVGFELILFLCTFVIEWHFRRDQERYNAMYTGREKSAFSKLLDQITGALFSPLYEAIMLKLERWKIAFDARANAIRAQREQARQLARARAEVNERIAQAKTMQEIAKLNQTLKREIEKLPDEFEQIEQPIFPFGPPQFAPANATTFQAGQTVYLDPTPSKAPSSEPAPQAAPQTSPARNTVTTQVVETDTDGLAACCRKWFERQYTSKGDNKKAENREKYRVGKARLLAAGYEIEEDADAMKVSITRPHVIES